MTCGKPAGLRLWLAMITEPSAYPAQIMCKVLYINYDKFS